VHKVRENKSYSAPLRKRIVVLSIHLKDLLNNTRLYDLFNAFGKVFYIDEHDHTDDSLLEACRGVNADTYLCLEYIAHRNSRRRLFRQHGLKYWHIGLGIARHYRTSRIDWAMYEDDTWLRHATNPDRLPAEPAISADMPISKALIIGQMHGDQAQQYGGLGFDSSLLVREVRRRLPDARLRYRPHPKALEKSEVLEADTIWYPDPYLMNPDPDVQISPHMSLAVDVNWADACITINSTAAYECLQAGKPVYNAGIPMLHSHPGGNFLLPELANGKRYVNRDYMMRLRGRLSEMQSNVQSVAYTPEQFMKHEFYMDGDYYGNKKPAVFKPVKAIGDYKGKLKDFAKVFKPKTRVLICGTGPSLHRIKNINLDNYTVIATNSACGMVDPDLCMLMNVNAWRFPQIWENVRGKMHLLSELLVANAGHYPYDYYEFEHLPPSADPVFEPWLLNNGGGVASRAIQVMASFPQVKIIHCIGMDSFNWHVHWHDVSEAPDGAPFKPYGKEVKATNALIKALEPRIEFCHYGPTALNMKVLG